MRWPSRLKISSTPRVFVNGYRIGYSLFDSQPNDIISQGELKNHPPMHFGTPAARPKANPTEKERQEIVGDRTPKPTLIEADAHGRELELKENQKPAG
jgi:hypothetical protein